MTIGLENLYLDIGLEGTTIFIGGLVKINIK